MQESQLSVLSEIPYIPILKIDDYQLERVPSPQSPNFSRHFEDVSPLDNPDFKGNSHHSIEEDELYIFESDDESRLLQTQGKTGSLFLTQSNQDLVAVTDFYQQQYQQQISLAQQTNLNYWYRYYYQPYGYFTYYDPSQIQSHKKVKTESTCKCTQLNGLKSHCECSSNNQFLTQSSIKETENPEEIQNPQEPCKKIVDTLSQVEDQHSAESLTLQKEISQKTPRIRKGCTCKKTSCQKKYCECFSLGMACLPSCKCTECQNSGETCSPDKRHIK